MSAREDFGYNDNPSIKKTEVFINKILNKPENENTEKEKFAIDFANWVDELSYTSKCSVWSKDGQHSGLFKMDNEQLMDKYKNLLKKR
jgi:hypothetical protein